MCPWISTSLFIVGLSIFPFSRIFSMVLLSLFLTVLSLLSASCLLRGVVGIRFFPYDWLLCTPTWFKNLITS